MKMKYKKEIKQQITLKEYKYIDGSKEFKEKNWNNYSNYLKENHPFYKKYIGKDINKEFNLIKGISVSKWGFKEWFVFSLITSLNYGHSFEKSLINAMLHTINKKALKDYIKLNLTPDKENYF